MNPDQPSREQIEARITALLLGELPAAEAELLRWTISQDPELQKLHDQLKGTIGFVREAMKNPTGAPMDAATPLKLPQDRRQTLLAHFKTARPQPPQKPELPWLPRIKIPSARSLAVAATVIFLVFGLVAISIPNFVKTRATSQVSACINNLRQIDAAKNEWALETRKSANAVPTANDLTPYLPGQALRSVSGETYVLGKVSEPAVAEFHGTLLTASGNSQAANSVMAEQALSSSIQNPYQSRGAGGGFGPQVTTVAGRETTSVAAKTRPTPAPIALPNTESSQTDSGKETGQVYSQSVVGYVDIHVNEANSQLVANQFVGGNDQTFGSTAPSSNREPIVAADGGVAGAGAVNTASWNLQAQKKSLSDTERTVNGPYVQKEFKNGVLATNYLANAMPGDQPQSFYRFTSGQGGEDNPQSPPATREIRNVNSGTVSFGGSSTVSPVASSPALGAPTDSVPELPRNSSVQNSPFNATNTVAMNQAQGRLASSLSDFSFTNGINWSQVDGDRNIGLSAVAPTPTAVPQVPSESAPPVPILAPPRLQQFDNGQVGARRDKASPELKDQLAYQEQESQIQSTQSNVDELRLKYSVYDTEPNAIGPSAIITSEQIQQLNEKILEQNARVIQNQKDVAEFQAIQATNPIELGDLLSTVKQDDTLSVLLGKLHRNEQGYVAGSNYLSAGNPDLSSSVALKQEITNRVNGIMFSLQTEVDAEKAGLSAMNQRLQDVENQGQNELEKDRPYWLAREQLQDEEDLHKLLSEKVEADKADAAMPKSALVTVVASAQPGQSQNLWQRMTGEVESRALIKIEPDIASSGPIAYVPYDPYYMESEVKSIQSDAVLGKVVDSLKLDQAWSKQADGEKLSREDAIAQLRSRLGVQSDKDSKLINIGAKSDNPEEAAKLANAVAEAYQDYRLEVHSNEMVAGIQHLQEQYAEEDKKIRELQAGLAEKNVPSHEREERVAAVTKAPEHDGDVFRQPQPSAPIPQPEIRTSDNAFSTFSLNVSDVSFKLAMASLEKGQLPAPASIRSEEFINAFDYHDPEPLQGEPLAFVSERSRDPFAQERDLLRFSIKAAAAGRQDGRALNLVLLLDTSGSMERADRVAIIREMLRVLSAQLQPHDVVSVVTFARTARLWADGVPGNEAGATFDKVGSITPEGGTNLEEAMRLAYETALRHFIAGGMNRVVLLTDGAANLGNVDPQALTQKVDSERRQGIALDCFGIGWDDYNDDLLEQLSSNGDGRYAFINSPDEARTEFATKLAGALQVAAEDVKVQVEFNPNRVTSWRQIGYAKHQLTKQQFRDNTVAAGAIASREAGNALYTIEPRADGDGPIATVRVRYRVPGTQDVHERSWLVEYTGAAPELTQSSPAMRLAVTAAETSEWMANSPFAQDVTPDELLNDLSGVPQIYGTDERPKQLEWMIRQADTLKR